jgi:hypothetical protein
MVRRDLGIPFHGIDGFSMLSIWSLGHTVHGVQNGTIPQALVEALTSAIMSDCNLTSIKSFEHFFDIQFSESTLYF